MISLKITKITDNLAKREKKLVQNSKKLGPYITEYVYAHIDNSLDRALVKIRDYYIYRKLTKDTGKLGKSMTPFRRKLNQFAIEIGLWFDKKIAPHAATQIPYNDRSTTTIVAHGKLLTVPIKGSPADIRGSRLKAAGHWLTPIRGILYKNDVPYFQLRHSVVVPQRIYTGTIRQYLMDPTVGNMSGAIHRLAKKALNQAIKDKII